MAHDKLKGDDGEGFDTNERPDHPDSPAGGALRSPLLALEMTLVQLEERDSWGDLSHQNIIKAEPERLGTTGALFTITENKHSGYLRKYDLPDMQAAGSHSRTSDTARDKSSCLQRQDDLFRLHVASRRAVSLLEPELSAADEWAKDRYRWQVSSCSCRSCFLSLLGA